MTGSRTHPQKTLNHPADDLKRICGVGPAFEQRLHEAGIFTFAQVASLSPEDFAALIPGYSPERITKQGWIQQARQLMPKPSQSEVHPKKNGANGGPQHYENYTVEFLLDQNSRTRRTRIIHIQSGETETWAGLDDTRLLDFLERRITKTDEHQLHETTVRSAPIPPDDAFIQTSGSDIALVVAAADIKPPDQSGETSQPEDESASARPEIFQLTGLEIAPCVPASDTGPIWHNQPYIVKVGLDPASPMLAGDVALYYDAQIFVKHLGGKCRLLVGKSGKVEPSSDYKICFANVTLPQGIFRLEAHVTLVLRDKATNTRRELSSYMRGKLLQVN